MTEFTLGLKLDGSGLKAGTNDLDRLKKLADEVERQLKKTGDSADKAGKQVGEGGKAAGLAAHQWTNLSVDDLKQHAFG